MEGCHTKFRGRGREGRCVSELPTSPLRHDDTQRP
jgi:hypothetical protein